MDQKMPADAVSKVLAQEHGRRKKQYPHPEHSTVIDTCKSKNDDADKGAQVNNGTLRRSNRLSGRNPLNAYIAYADTNTPSTTANIRGDKVKMSVAPIAFPTSIAGISTTISSRAISLFKWIPRSAEATKSNTANKGMTIGTGITCARRGAATSADPNPVRLKMIYARAIATTATESSGIVNTVKLQAQSPRPILCSSARNDRLDSWTYSPSRARFPDGYDGSNSIKCLDLQGFHPTMR